MPQGIARVEIRNRSIVQRVPPSAGMQVAVAAAFRKGPLRPTLVTGQTDLLRRFTVTGSIPVNADDAHWSAHTYLEDGDQLWVNRVAPGAAFAALAIGQAHDRVGLKSKPAAGSDQTAADTEEWVDSSSAAVTDSDIVAATTAGADYRGASATDITTNPTNGDVYFNTATDVLRQYNLSDTEWNTLYTDDEISTALTALSQITGTAVFLGIMDGTTDTSLVGAALAARSVGTFSSVSADTAYLFIDTGDSNKLKQVTAYTMGGSSEPIGTGYNASGTASKSLVDGSSNPLSETQIEGYADFAALVNGDANTKKAPELVLIYAASPGAWGDNLRVTAHEYTALDSRADVTPGEVVELRVWENGILVTGESHAVSRTQGLKDGRGESLYIEDVLRRNSEYIRAVDGMDPTGQSRFIEVVQEDVRFNGEGYIGSEGSDGSLGSGSDGTTPTSADYVAAYDAFGNQNVYPDIKLILDGGFADEAIAAGVAALAANRVDSQGIINLPLNAFNSGWESDTSDVTMARGYMAQPGITKTKYLAAYGPRLLMTDQFNRREIYVPVDGVAAGRMAALQREGRPYAPPAGPENGQVIGFLDVKERLTDAQLDIMVDTLRVNPFRFESGYGINIWDQLTLDPLLSAESEVHVRLMLMDIGPRLKRALRGFLFRGNNAAQRRLVTSLVTNFMGGVQRRGGVDRFQVVCDSTNNTIVEEQQNRMVVWLFIWPTGVTKYIDLYPILTPRGVSINDAIEAVAA